MKSKIFLRFCVLMIIMPLFFACPIAYGTAENTRSYSPDIMELAKNLLASYELFEKGKRLFEKRDYPAAQTTFKKALDKDPKNKKAKKYLKLCDRKIAAMEKTKKDKEKKEKRIKAKQQERSERKQQVDIEARRLKDLEKRIRELEARKDKVLEKAPKIAVQPKLITKIPVAASTTATPESFTEKTIADTKLKKTVLLEEEIRKNVLESESLVEQGNLCFQNQEYEKAYDLYKNALKKLK